MTTEKKEEPKPAQNPEPKVVDKYFGKYLS